MESGAVKRAGIGHPLRLPERVLANKGYTSGKVRMSL